MGRKRLSEDKSTGTVGVLHPSLLKGRSRTASEGLSVLGPEEDTLIMLLMASWGLGRVLLLLRAEWWKEDVAAAGVNGERWWSVLEGGHSECCHHHFSHA